MVNLMNTYSIRSKYLAASLLLLLSISNMIVARDDTKTTTTSNQVDPPKPAQDSASTNQTANAIEVDDYDPEVIANTSNLPDDVDFTGIDQTTNSPGESADSTTNSSSEQSDKTTTTTKKPSQCSETNLNYCFNGGTCVINEQGAMVCICPEEFYGARCQTRNICKTIIVDSLTGDKICARINRECVKNDRFFRCSCMDDEYFIFKPNYIASQSKQQASSSRPSSSNIKHRQDNNIHYYDGTTKHNAQQVSQTHIVTDFVSPQSSTFGYYSTTSESSNSHISQPNIFDMAEPTESPPSYLAECRKVDKCLGVRCKQMSEVCHEGECICNSNLGYIKDPQDDFCKLLNPCKMPTPDGAPICGQASCVATLDSELFRCICPVGYRAVQVSTHKASTQCVLMTDTICEIPLLNKCQHICHVDQTNNKYKCSCLAGYKAGTRPGIDHHMCFFDELFERPDYLESTRDANPFDDYRYPATTMRTSSHNHMSGKDYVFKKYPRQKIRSDNSPGASLDNLNKETVIPYDSSSNTTNKDRCATDIPPLRKVVVIDEDDIEIKRVPRELINSSGGNAAGNSRLNGGSGSGSGGGRDDDHFADVDLSELSAQDRCNLYCEENKICVLENGSTDSYRCVCDRQGYVSVGDRCLDWCSAAEFSYKVRRALDYVCYTGSCSASSSKPARATVSMSSSGEIHKPLSPSSDPSQETDVAELERRSSWRPSFECDCTNSPLLTQDPETKLCKLNFQAVINPCLPGNVGYIDCVENKKAYCSVLYSSSVFMKSLQKERPIDQPIESIFGQQHKSMADDIYSATGTGNFANSGKSSKLKVMEQSYVCVCSPDKKFLVDKPRKKARCVDECDLLNNECGRFNRMCRVATIELEDFGKENLIRFDFDGPIMNFKRTGCECLPGFNVGPTESLDFTLDDNNRFGSSSASSQSSLANIQRFDTYTSIFDVNPNPSEHIITKYININSRCLLDYDVVEFQASFKAPADFDPHWIKIRNSTLATQSHPHHKSAKSNALNLNSASDQASKPNHDDRSAELMKQGKTKKFIKVDSIEASRNDPSSSSSKTHDYTNQLGQSYIFELPHYMRMNIGDLNKAVVFVAQCEPSLAKLSPEAYQECLIYRYWIVRKLRNHFADWRRVLTAHLRETFDLMEGNIRLHVNKCEATIRGVKRFTGSGDNSTSERASKDGDKTAAKDSIMFDPLDPNAVVDADVDCELTLHSASDGSAPRYSRKVLLEKQLQKFIFTKQAKQFGQNYYLMAPKVLVRHETFDQLAEHRKLFNPCKSSYAYCDKQTKCEMVDSVNFTCTCQAGYTPIGSRDLYLGDSRKEVCEDINECLFDICKDLENSTCINEIGDYRCQCDRHFTGDNKRYCTHVCNTIPCKHGKCRLVDDHHAFCECEDGYKEADCSVQDPSVALRKANMIICGAIFASVLLLAITLAISLNSQLKKTKKKLRRLESANEAAHLFDLNSHQQPFRPRLSKVSVCS